MNYIGLFFKIKPLVPARDILIAELDLLEFESFIETEDGLEEYVLEDQYNEGEFKILWVLDNPEFEISYEQKLIKDQNWNATWEASFEPIEVEDKVRIRAPFHETSGQFQYELLIQPQMSFGTGHHQTTWLIMREMTSMQFEDKHVLDMGCGTGILAILAEEMGAGQLEGIDIDEWAYENTLENIKLNACSKITVHKGGVEAVSQRNFDIILANINKNILMSQLSEYASWIKPQGELLLSGFFNQDADDLILAAKKVGFEFKNKETREEWAMLHLIKS